MQLRVISAFALLALGALALACTSETTVLPADQEPPGLTVTGSGSVFGQPDVAVLNLGVHAEADTVAEAREQAATAMQAIQGALEQSGVQKKDMQTTHFSVQPKFDLVDKKMVLIGFAVDNVLTVKIRNIDTTGAVIDSAVAAGGDLTRIESLHFTMDDPSSLEDQARQQAVAEARRKAETLARAAGVSLGPPRTISEGGGLTPIPFEAAARFDLAQAAEAPTPIELGELEVRVDVQVVYTLVEES